MERSIRPESIAFGVFGLIAALAALSICGQVVGRLVRRNADDGEVLRALGAGPVMTDGRRARRRPRRGGARGVLAVAVAVGLSPLAPVRRRAAPLPGPGRRLRLDRPRLGFAVLVVVLGAASVLVAYRARPTVARHWAAQVPSGHGPAAGGRRFRPAARRGRPASARRLGGGSRDDAAPVRSAVLGAVLAVVVVVTSITFGASLNALVSQSRALRVELELRAAVGLLGGRGPAGRRRRPPCSTTTRTWRWAGVYFETMQIDGQRCPSSPSPERRRRPDAAAGHGLAVGGPGGPRARHPGRAAQAVGDTVVADTGADHQSRLRIVGTATLPTIGGSGNPELQMGTGAVVASDLFPAADLTSRGARSRARTPS